MQGIYVKICGLTRPDQAQAVGKLGADAIGLMFAESKRQVDVDQGRDVAAAAGAKIEKVGVFVDADAGQIAKIIEQTGITRVQLHGSEQPDIVEAIPVPCWKAFGVRDEGFAGEIRDWVERLGTNAQLEAIMLDAYDPRAVGGTGKSFNWDLVAKARSDGLMDDLPPIILAGGLDPANVAEAIAAVRPWGVDVSSGVESSPGVKDMNKVEAFLRAAGG